MEAPQIQEPEIVSTSLSSLKCRPNTTCSAI